MSHAPAKRPTWLVWWFSVLTGLTWVLIIVGALVRAHGAGLACPDWPLCFGELVPTLDAGVALEWGHRVFAGSISLGLTVGTVVVWRRPRLWKATRLPVILSLVVLAVQIVLGGLTVLELLAAWTVTSHLLVGNLFCATLLWVTLNLWDAHDEAPAPHPLAAGGRVLALLGAVFVALVAQLALGGLVSSQYAGLACPTWPACAGSAWFPTWEGLVGLHLMHRWNAILVAGLYAALFVVARHEPGLRRHTTALLGLVLLQVALGVGNVLMRLPVELTALHTATAAALVLTTVATLRLVLRARAASTASVPQTGDPLPQVQPT